jgi:hypothetical protein
MSAQRVQTSVERSRAADAADDARAARLRDRFRRRLLIASVVGPVVGLVAGILVGSTAFEVGGLGFWMVLIGCIIFATALSLLIAGYSSLESPDPGAEPSQVERPIADRPGATRPEGDVLDEAAGKR